MLDKPPTLDYATARSARPLPRWVTTLLANVCGVTSSLSAYALIGSIALLAINGPSKRCALAALVCTALTVGFGFLAIHLLDSDRTAI